MGRPSRFKALLLLLGLAASGVAAPLYDAAVYHSTAPASASDGGVPAIGAPTLTAHDCVFSRLIIPGGGFQPAPSTFEAAILETTPLSIRSRVVAAADITVGLSRAPPVLTA